LSAAGLEIASTLDLKGERKKMKKGVLGSFTEGKGVRNTKKKKKKRRTETSKRDLRFRCKKGGGKDALEGKKKWGRHILFFSREEKETSFSFPKRKKGGHVLGREKGEGIFSFVERKKRKGGKT